MTADPTEARLIECLGLLPLADWVFFPVHEGLELAELRGVRAWPDGWADALMIRSSTDAAALRCDPTGGIVWNRNGALEDVLTELLALPSSGSSTGPRLVRANTLPAWLRPAPCGSPTRPTAEPHQHL